MSCMSRFLSLCCVASLQAVKAFVSREYIDFLVQTANQKMEENCGGSTDLFLFLLFHFLFLKCLFARKKKKDFLGFIHLFNCLQKESRRF
uniref:Secreted protein n=1 Tax=Salarias fasciatus TaxID=181472 RepID=A0A672HRW4_SALFA